MDQLDHSGISTSDIARHEVVSLGPQNGSLVLVTNGEISEERREMFEFVYGRPVQLESLDTHPELQDIFHQTVAAYKEVLATQPTRFSESAKEFLGRLNKDVGAK